MSSPNRLDTLASIEQRMAELQKEHYRQLRQVTWAKSEAMVMAHLRTIFRKLDVENRSQAVTWARQNGIC
jgi:DNA-binding CsgD family transcriptional regulator